MASLLNLPVLLVSHLLASLNQGFRYLTQPARHSLVLGTIADLTRSRAQLIAENALLRQQLIVLRRQVKKPLSWPKISSVSIIAVKTSYLKACELGVPKNEVFGQDRLYRVIREYARYFNRARPYPGLGQYPRDREKWIMGGGLERLFHSPYLAASTTIIAGQHDSLNPVNRADKVFCNHRRS